MGCQDPGESSREYSLWLSKADSGFFRDIPLPSGMYSDAIQDPRASVQTVPGRSASGSAGRGRGRGGRGRGGVRGVGGMQVD